MPDSGTAAGSPTSTAEERSELITATGWRLVGEAADLVSDPVGVTAVAALRQQDILHASEFLVVPRSAKTDAVSLVLSVLNVALSRGPEGSEALTRTGTFARMSGRFHGAHWDTFTFGNQWAGELTWIHPHPVLAGVPCTTHVSLVKRGTKVGLTVHVGARGGRAAVRGLVGAGQARPAFMSELHRVAQLRFDGEFAERRTLERSGTDKFVSDVLLSENRTYPVAVLSPVEPSDYLDPPEYLLPPHQLETELLGLAHLYVIDRHPTTFGLSDALGDRRLSCYWGALRIYMPDFSCADSGLRHPLVGRDRVEDPVERAGLVGELGLAAGERIPVPDVVETLRRVAEPPRVLVEPEDREAETPPAAAPRRRAGEEPLPSDESGAPAPDASQRVLTSLERFTDRLGAKLDSLLELQERLVDEVARLRTATVVRAANASGVERRLGHFERLLRDHLRQTSAVEEETPYSLGGSEGEGAQPDGLESPEAYTGGEEEAPEDSSDLTLVSVLQHVESESSEDLLVLDSAMASAAESPYEDVHRVAMNLKAMAELARRRQDGRLGMSLRDAFAEAGIDYRGGIARSTSKRQRQQYEAILPNGKAVDCHEHIVLGSSYDPRYCLRIYFTSRAPGEPRFVIAHVGRHFEVASTS